MKKQLLTIAIVGLTTVALRAGITDAVNAVASVPGQAVNATGQMVQSVGSAITPSAATQETAAGAVLAVPGNVVSGAGKAVSAVGNAITPASSVKSADDMAKSESVVEMEPMMMDGNEEMMDAAPSSGTCPVAD